MSGVEALYRNYGILADAEAAKDIVEVSSRNKFWQLLLFFPDRFGALFSCSSLQQVRGHFLQLQKIT